MEVTINNHISPKDNLKTKLCRKRGEDWNINSLFDAKLHNRVASQRFWVESESDF